MGVKPHEATQTCLGRPTIVADNYRGARSGTEHLLRTEAPPPRLCWGDPSLDSAKQRKRGHLESVSLSSADSGTHRWRNAVSVMSYVKVADESVYLAVGLAGCIVWRCGGVGLESVEQLWLGELRVLRSVGQE